MSQALAPAPPRPATRQAAAASLAAFALLLALHLGGGVPVEHLTRDPTATMEAPFYLGLLSHVGVLLWTAAAAICLFTARLLRGGAEAALWRPFLLAAGAFTLLLALDDLFLLHDEVAPTHLGVPEGIVVGGYGVMMGAFLVRFRAVVLRTAYPVLLVALAFLAASVALDALPALLLALGASPEDASPALVGAYFLAEDGAKFAGIAFWLSYFADAAARAAPPPSPS